MKRRVLVWKQLRQWSHWGVVACFVTLARWNSGVTGVLWHVLSPWQDETVMTLVCCGMFCHHGKMKQWRLGCCGMFCHHGKMRQWRLWGVVACFVTPQQDDRTCQIWCTACLFCHLSMVCHHMRTKHAKTLAMVTLFLLGGAVGAGGRRRQAVSLLKVIV